MAVTSCESNPACGGFTFKGFLNRDLDVNFEIYFFHIVSDIHDDIHGYGAEWITYVVDREEELGFTNFDQMKIIQKL